MAEAVTEFQRAILQNFRHGRLADLADASDHKKLMAAVRRQPDTELIAALLEAVKGLDDIGDVSTLLMTAEIDVKDAMAAVGSVATIRHSMK
jgi:hypothetical protein